jgi:FlaA1/EpsC-like NDP-sugar epimerase
VSETTELAPAGVRAGLPSRVAAHARRDAPLGMLDALLVVATYVAALILRFNGHVPSDRWHDMRRVLPGVVLIHLFSNYLIGLYGQMWRYASVPEARRVLVSGITSAALVFGFVVFIGRGSRPIPLSVVVLGSVSAAMAFGAIRFKSRLFTPRRRPVGVPRTRVLLMGAGDAGAQVLGDILRTPELGLHVVGLIDDDPRRVGRALHSVPVFGGRDRIPRLASKLGADQVLLAIPTATSDLIRDVATLCEEAGVSLRVLPTLGELVHDHVTARDLRDLRIEDLLGRQQVTSDLASVRQLLRGRRVLITGAGGSIGSEVARQVGNFEPASLALVDNDETHLHDLLATLDGAPITSVLADVRDRERMLDVFREHRPQVVFHAAAHKHVPILEHHPQEALFTNVLGTANVVEAAAIFETKRFVLISTDKAVRPTSVMGGSKRMAEDIVRGLSGRGTVLCVVRFGNVLGSRGSVVPTFLSQIAAGGPVTVTDPAMTRYFMSVEEAVQLVLQAAALARGGEVFTLDMGEPVNILELAHKLIRLSGRVPGRDIAVQVIGPRLGEKRHEELVQDDEVPEPTGHPGIVVATPPLPNPATLRRRLREMEALAKAGCHAELAELMRRPGTGDIRVSTAVGELL